MAVSSKTDLRFPEYGQQGHGTRIIQSTVVMLILYIVIGSIVDFVPVCKNGIIYLLAMYAILNVATQSRGKRFVNNVFTCDIYVKNKEKSE